MRAWRSSGAPELKVAAECVDSEGRAKFLRPLRCYEMQGYLLSHPVPLDQLAALLAQATKGQTKVPLTRSERPRRALRTPSTCATSQAP